MADFGGNVARLKEFSALLELGLSKVFKDDLPTHPKLYRDCIVEKKAKEYIEDELVTTGFGPMPTKAVGGVITTDKPYISSPKDYELVPHALGFVAEYELIRWERYGVFSNLTRKLSRSGVDRKNVLVFAIFNNSFSTADSVYTTYASEALCATSHTLLRGGTGANRPSTDVGVTYLGFQEAITDFATLTNEDGLYIRLTPDKVLVHPTNRYVAETLVGSEYRPDNANMALNTLRGKGLGVYDSPYLSNTAYWWMLADKSKLEISFHIGDDLQFRRDFEASTWNNVFSMYGSFRVAVLHWYGVWGTQGA